MCHSSISLTYSFLPLYGHEVDIISNANVCQEYFLGLKGASVQSWHSYQIHVPTVLKSGILKKLQNSGLFQACEWIPLPLISFGNTFLIFRRTDWLRTIWCTSDCMDRYPAEFRTEVLRCRRETGYCLSRRGRLQILNAWFCVFSQRVLWHFLPFEIRRYVAAYSVPILLRQVSSFKMSGEN
jgi:hypothetical protein